MVNILWPILCHSVVTASSSDEHWLKTMGSAQALWKVNVQESWQKLMEIFSFHENLNRGKKEKYLCLWQLCYWVVHSVPHPVYALCSEYKHLDSIFFGVCNKSRFSSLKIILKMVKCGWWTGNAKTALVINIAPCSEFMQESLSSLQFGSRVKLCIPSPNLFI